MLQCPSCTTEFVAVFMLSVEGVRREHWRRAVADDAVGRRVGRPGEGLPYFGWSGRTIAQVSGPFPGPCCVPEILTPNVAGRRTSLVLAYLRNNASSGGRASCAPANIAGAETTRPNRRF